MCQDQNQIKTPAPEQHHLDWPETGSSSSEVSEYEQNGAKPSPKLLLLCHSNLIVRVTFLKLFSFTRGIANPWIIVKNGSDIEF